MAKKSLHIFVSGMVQGVGFRFFVQSLATELKLTGWVRNSGNDVEIRAEGGASVLSDFLRRLRLEAPSRANVAHVEANDCPPLNASDFAIVTTG